MSALTTYIPTQLRNYTHGATRMEAAGQTIDETLHTLDARYPGLCFRMADEQGRIRKHMRIFVDGERVEEVGARVGPRGEDA